MNAPPLSALPNCLQPLHACGQALYLHSCAPLPAKSNTDQPTSVPVLLHEQLPFSDLALPPPTLVFLCSCRVSALRPAAPPSPQLSSALELSAWLPVQ